MSVCIGFYSLQYNGVAHSNSFTALLATTGDSDLHQLSQGHSLGALPLDKEMSAVKVRFGALVKDGGTRNSWEEGQPSDEVGRVGFGPAQNVVGLVKGGQYI